MCLHKCFQENKKTCKQENTKQKSTTVDQYGVAEEQRVKIGTGRMQEPEDELQKRVADIRKGGMQQFLRRT